MNSGFPQFFDDFFDLFNPLPDLPFRCGNERRIIEEMLKLAE
ncbi:hypothetical protein UFOVP1244_11 [uncultured Caudovirales phage]|uniref:Uncharacterized protein n=1 Tax=uncultured Caudovirales phage TaxID=2100421 RepID=A0A6J5R611_9CAUD|nr:hypothetical protein UFOVP1244_11 [uncultured Caudovirales phage]